MFIRIIFWGQKGKQAVEQTRYVANTGSHKKDSPTKVEEGHRQPDRAHDTLKCETYPNAIP